MKRFKEGDITHFEQDVDNKRLYLKFDKYEVTFQHNEVQLYENRHDMRNEVLYTDIFQEP